MTDIEIRKLALEIAAGLYAKSAVDVEFLLTDAERIESYIKNGLPEPGPKEVKQPDHWKSAVARTF